MEWEAEKPRIKSKKKVPNQNESDWGLFYRKKSAVTYSPT